MKFKVTNWGEYEVGLRPRGCLTRWVTSEALGNWPAPRRKMKGGQPHSSDLAIETTLMLLHNSLNRNRFKVKIMQQI
jgi:hypothetical protein